MHRDIVLRTLAVALRVHDTPRRVLDIGCGTGLLLRVLVERVPTVERLVGIDPASGMIEVARSLIDDPRLTFSTGVAESLPHPEASFDLVVSTTSFDHWKDQKKGLTECARVLEPSGHFVLTDLFSLWLSPTLLVSHRGHARTRDLATGLLSDAGFERVEWHRLYGLVLATAVASKARRQA